MRRFQKIALFLAPFVAFLLFTDPALAVTHGGQGLAGNLSDSQITNAMFFLLGFFPVVIIVFSILQAVLENRKHKKVHARLVADRAKAGKGGW